jgi:hypothetical protein
MSDYFGALIRSSAMVLGGQAPARAVPHAVPSLEVVGERVAPALTTHAEIAPAVAMTPAAATAQSVPDKEPVGETSADAVLHAVTVAASPADSAKASPGTWSQPAVAPDAKASPAHELVRAAMRWVAADPQQAPTLAERARQEERASSLPGATVVEVLTLPPAHVDLTELESRSFAIPADACARAITPVGSTLLERPAHSERLEISIGAIHLRVDAPAPQTTARTPAVPPTPTRSPQAATASSRSALARRALRRI